jgi:hypothetical protein
MYIRIYSRLCFVIVRFSLLAILYITSSNSALANLIVIPTRVILDNARTAEVQLINQSTSEKTYRITLEKLNMLPDGTYEKVDVENVSEIIPPGILRFSPRQTTLKPNEKQTIRIMKMRRDQNTEYQIHMLFREVPHRNTGIQLERKKGELKEFQARVVPIFGVSIPVIIRYGNTLANLEIRDVKILKSTRKDDPGWEMNLQVTRSGNASVIGNLDINLMLEDDKKRPVGYLKEVGIYQSTPYRNMKIKLDLAESFSPSGRSFFISYSDAESKNSSKILTQKIFVAP